MQLFKRQCGPVETSSGPKFDYSWQLHSHTFKGLGNRDHIETLPYVQEILNSGWTLSSHKNKFLRLLLSKLHSLLDRSVHWGYGCFRVDFRSLLQVTYNLSKQCIEKQYIIVWYNLQACCIAGYRDITPGSELGSSLVKVIGQNLT